MSQIDRLKYHRTEAIQKIAHLKQEIVEIETQENEAIREVGFTITPTLKKFVSCPEGGQNYGNFFFGGGGSKIITDIFTPPPLPLSWHEYCHPTATLETLFFSRVAQKVTFFLSQSRSF